MDKRKKKVIVFLSCKDSVGTYSLIFKLEKPFKAFQIIKIHFDCKMVTIFPRFAKIFSKFLEHDVQSHIFPEFHYEVISVLFANHGNGEKVNMFRLHGSMDQCGEFCRFQCLKLNNAILQVRQLLN